jgi:hypothetical protein
LIFALLAAGAAVGMVSPVSAQSGCEGTSGSALINGNPWNANCVVAATSTSCVDTTGGKFECFQIFAADSSASQDAIAIFLDQAPTQGLTYQLGGTSGNGAMILGMGGLWMTGNPPYTGQIHVSVYDPGSATIECTFSFTGRNLVFGPDATVTNGTLVGRLVAIRPTSWSDVKDLYRAPQR